MEIGSLKWNRYLTHGAEMVGVTIPSQRLNLFTTYAKTLCLWNKKMNLTRIVSPEDIAIKHFVDCLFPGSKIQQGARILDLGSGAGFPGIPLKIVWQDFQITLVDASRKRVNFLKHMIRTLRLKEIDAIHQRAEELALIEEHGKRYDIVIARAVTSFPQLVEMGNLFLKKNGVLMAMKGTRESDWPVPDKMIRKKISYHLPYAKGNRTLFICSYP